MNIAIIGGGAAGMMAACAAAEYGASVTVFERNRRCGIKLNLTGKGRCNLTNDCGVEQLIQNVPRNGKFLYSAFSNWDSEDVQKFFIDCGLPLKAERGNRVFPQSDSAKDVTAALERCMKSRGVRIVYGARIADIKVRDGAAAAVIDQNGGEYPFDSIIIATGGLSYPKTGSSGDGYAIAEKLGHKVVKTRPSLVPLIAKGDMPARLEGLSLRNVALGITSRGKRIFTDFGEMLFTSNGLSGPMILSASAHITPDLFPCDISVDLKPALDAETLDSRILRDFSSAQNRAFSNALGSLLPAKLIPVMVELSGIQPERKVNSVTKAERERLCALVKSLPLTVTALGPYSEAVITSGGIDVRQLDPKTIGSKLIRGLYFAGEVIDADAYTGGFNLQIAWSTAVAAGRAAAMGQ